MKLSSLARYGIHTCMYTQHIIIHVQIHVCAYFCNELEDLDEKVQWHVARKHKLLATGKQALQDDTQPAVGEGGGGGGGEVSIETHGRKCSVSHTSLS